MCVCDVWICMCDVYGVYACVRTAMSAEIMYRPERCMLAHIATSCLPVCLSDGQILPEQCSL